MKNIALTLAVLMMLSVFPLTLYAGPNYIIENDTISMPKANPTVDATINAEDGWSKKAYFNIDTASNFWDVEPLTTTADLYFAYSDEGLYFAGDITDKSYENGNNFVYSTGEDDVDGGVYGWNGDVFTLMLDPLDGLFNAGYFGNSDFTPWYHIGLFKNSDGTETARMYRNKINEGELTEKDGVVLAGKTTENGWIVEAFIPWSVIAQDIYDISVGGVSVTVEELAADGTAFSGAILYHDRYRMSNGEVRTWGRFVTVCETCQDGTPGYWTAGVCIKALGLNMVNYDHSAHHEWSEWSQSIAPNCKDDGQESRSCSVCGEIETRPIAASGEHSFGEWGVTTAPTCTENGVESRVCVGCGTTETRALAAGHDFGEWQTTVEPTPDKEGERQRVCAGCGKTEIETIPAIGDVSVSWENYTVKITGAAQLDYIRYASGVHTTLDEIREAEDLVNINAGIIAENTVDGVYIREMPKGGVYSFWVRLTDGSSFIKTVDLTQMTQTVTSTGLTMTVHDLYGVRDYFIAKGNYSSYSELKGNYTVRITSNKIGDLKSYGYVVKEPGDYTVCVRYNDERDDLILYHTIEVVMPEITVDGLQVRIAKLDDIKVIRTAPGEWNTSGEVKRAPGCRNFTARNAIKGSDPYTIQYREDGVYTVVVEYTTGLCVVEQVAIEHKEPTFEQNGSSVTFGDLDGLYIIRYAPGEYTTSAEIKRAEGSKFVRPAAIVDGKITIDGLDAGTYTFCVQYTDESFNYYTVNTHKFGDWYVVTAATTARDGKEERKCETCGATEDRVIPAVKMTIAGNDISKYKIVYGSSAASPVKTAANNLASWIKECYGVSLTVTTDSAAASDYEILVGKTNRESSGLVSVDRSSENELSYVINVQGSRLVIAGQTDSSRRRGTLYGAYYFAEEVLGYHFLLDSLIIANPRAAHLTSDYSVKDGPGYEMRTVYWKTGWEDVYLNHEDYYVGSNWVHDLGEWIDGSSASAPNPCLSKEANIQKVITKAKKVLGSKDTVWVSQNDSTEYCKCDDCMAIYREDGSRAATLIRLCNRVCESLESTRPDAKILTLAYQYSVVPPKVTKIHRNVIVYFCTIDNCMSCPYSDTTCVLNKQITENFTGWGELCEKVYIWDYSTNFTYNVSPYPTFDTMLENARWFHENGARGVFNNAVTGTNGEFGELRAYLLTRIYRDPYMTEEEYYTHMDNFLKGYYGSGWRYIREYIDTVEAWANENHWNCHAPIASVFNLEKVASEENVAYLNSLWDMAEAGASGSTQLNRVKRSRLSCTYLIQNATFERLVTNGTDATREAYYAANEAFYNSIKSFGVQWRESGGITRYDKYTAPINW